MPPLSLVSRRRSNSQRLIVRAKAVLRDQGCDLRKIRLEDIVCATVIAAG
jgi:hypothetical protein